MGCGTDHGYSARERQTNLSRDLTDDLAGMVKELLIQLYKAKWKLKPTKIILYWDGVREGQFDQVHVHELRVVRVVYHA